MNQDATHTYPLDLADRCVKCGLCLPHCPTYQVTQNEAESPRGRIMLMQGLANGMLEPSGQLEKHLDQCLTCRACEVVCPADVPYGELIDQGRQMLSQQRINQPPMVSKLLTAVLISRSLRRLSGWGLWLYQRLGLQRLLRHSHLLGKTRLARLEYMLPTITRPGRPRPSTPRRSVGRVALFTGCVSEWLEGGTLRDAVQVLNACGYEVDVPTSQGCCGALYQHNGDLSRAHTLGAQNLRAFAGNYEAIVGIASGCTAQLAEYDVMLKDGKTGEFSGKVFDISSFLAKSGIKKLTFRPLEARIAVHDPCTLRNVLRQQASVYDIIREIPGIDLKPLSDNSSCCGAAGNYFITQPEMADKLGEKKRQAIQTQAPDMVLTSNVGCAMQLKAQIKQAGLEIPVLHPVSLLRQQLNGHSGNA